jgi:AcrR family transcriptional regulator
VVELKKKKKRAATAVRGRTDRHVRADAQRSLEVLLQSAVEVFETAGVNAPVRAIAEKAGVGIATLYRHFPQRSDLIAAVFQHEIEALAADAVALAAKGKPGAALVNWIGRYAALVRTKHGLAPALHSASPAFEKLRAYFWERVRPALQVLLDSAAEAGEIRADVDADDVLGAVASLCMPAHDDRAGYSQRMVDVLIDGLRHGARASTTRAR